MIQNTNYKRKQKKQNQTKEPHTPSTLWSHFKLNVLDKLEKKAASAFLNGFYPQENDYKQKSFKVSAGDAFFFIPFIFIQEDMAKCIINFLLIS